MLMHRIAWLKLLLIVLVVPGVSFHSSQASRDLINVNSSASTSSTAGLNQTSSLLRITDVSPDRPWGAAPGNREQDPGGQVDAIAIDPNNERIIYAASETAGVWKSIDAARSWEWSSTGLRNGATITVGPALAIDDRASNRLLYATKHDDFRRLNPFGGLYVSTDAAATWSHVDLPNCATPSIQAVAFSAGRAVVGTGCGVFVSRDLSRWTNSTPVGSTSGFFVSASGPNVYACSGTLTWQSKEPASTNLSWTAGPQLAGACSALTPAPDEPDAKLLVLYSAPPSNRMVVGIVDYSRRPPRVASLPANATAIFRSEGSGERVLVAARRPSVPVGQGPGLSYDLFLGRGDFFFQFRPGTRLGPAALEPGSAWIRIGNFHIDTHGFAVAPSYDPERRRCVAYAATDGGVFATETCGTRPQALTDARWVQAMHGLHAFGTYAIAGISQRNCLDAPCAALYASSNDNGMWATRSGGRAPKGWRPMGCCGDNGDALIDPGVSAQALKQVATFRLGALGVFRSADVRPPVTPRSLADGYPIDITIPTLRRGITQILTPRGQAAPMRGDYLAIRRTSSRDTIVRNTDPSPNRPRNWVDIAPNNPFPQGSVVAVQASNGPITPTVYVLTFGQSLSANLKGVWKGIVRSGTVPEGSWQLMSNGLNNAINLFVNPYDPNHLYVSDLGDQEIKSSKDGGQTWQSEPMLTRFATRNGEFLFDCGRIDNYEEEPWYPGASESHRYACPLNSMVFVRDRPEIRVAVLHPGGIAFSRDSGANWISLPVTELIDIPFGAFYDTEINPATNTPSLYIALRGRGVIRVDAPFNTLASLNFELRGLPETRNGSVVAVNDTTGHVTPLSPGPDGVYRGTELFDAAVTPRATHVYRYVINNQFQSSQFQRTINSGETACGVANVIDDVTNEIAFGKI